MRWSEIGGERCSVARTLSVIGERWTMLVLREAFMGVRRFEEIQHRTGAARPVLSDRLRQLTEAGILRRVRYAEKPDRYEYRLTRKGVDLYPVIVSLMSWGDQHMDDGNGAPVRLTHRDCEGELSPTLSCGTCGRPVTAHDVRATTSEHR
ncbi:winged helix-turn-helix transcriptional regulator [Cryptosporangium sp. NPDC051539]|uniref:winged helix-turn-helix transcriptional regulator n=1 Tax=Cryptosporangium sp. NPDC051539 TaxID=3363962 RepID=UPI0037B5A1F7